MTLAEEILSVLKKHLEKEDTYINPNFLMEVNNALYNYYKLEDDRVEELIQSMWSW